MSCSSSRAFHNICPPSCPTGEVCPCPSRAAFQCLDLCPCPALQDNLLFTGPELRATFCDFIETRSLANGCTSATDTAVFAACLGATGWPAFGCPVEVGVVPDGFSGPFTLVTTVRNGVAVAGPTVATLDGLFNVAIDGMACINDTIDVTFG